MNKREHNSERVDR